MEKFTWEEAQKLFTNNKKYFVMFTTTWCGDCKMIKPEIEKKLVNKFNDKPIRFIEIDAEEANLFRKNEDGWHVAKVPAFFTVNHNQHHLIGFEYIPIPIIEKAIIDVLQ